MPPRLELDQRRVLDALRWIVRELRLAQNPGGGLSAAQAFVLHVLREHGPQCLGELASLTATDPSSVSVVVRKLHEKGLVVKKPSPEDRRRLRIALTAAGSRLVAKAPVPVQEVLIERLASFAPGELATLAELLERVAPRPEPAPPAPMFFSDGAYGGRPR